MFSMGQSFPKGPKGPKLRYSGSRSPAPNTVRENTSRPTRSEVSYRNAISSCPTTFSGCPNGTIQSDKSAFKEVRLRADPSTTPAGTHSEGGGGCQGKPCNSGVSKCSPATTRLLSAQYFVTFPVTFSFMKGPHYRPVVLTGVA